MKETAKCILCLFSTVGYQLLANEKTEFTSIQSLCTKKHVFVKINVTGSTAMKTLVCKLYRPDPWNFHSLRNFPTNLGSRGGGRVFKLMKGLKGKYENKLELPEGMEADGYFWNNTMKPLLQLGISFL